MAYLRLWKRWIRPLVLMIYFLLLLVALPLMIVEFETNGVPLHLKAWFIGGFFVLVSIPLSIWDIMQHLVYYTQPHLQRHIIRILWMVPIYALNAWFALRFPEAAIYLDTMRECYEAYVIYNFMTFLMNYLHSAYDDFEDVFSKKSQVTHLAPFCCMKPWKMGRHFIQLCKHGTLQYTIIRPITTVLALICELCHKYNEGAFSFKSAWLYLVIVNNISQVWALYCLVLFYQATKEELAPINPVWKFLCVKFVVFFSFWQSVFIAILEASGVISGENTGSIFSDKQKVAKGIQDFAICIEMFLAAMAHHYSFSCQPYVDLAADPIPCWSSFKSMWDVSDIRDDVAEHVRAVGNTVKGTVIRAQPVAENRSEKTPLLVSESESEAAAASYYSDDNTMDRSAYRTADRDQRDSPLLDIGETEVELHTLSESSPGKRSGYFRKGTPDDVLSSTSSIDFQDSDVIGVPEPSSASLNNFLQSGSSIDSRLSENTLRKIYFNGNH